MIFSIIIQMFPFLVGVQNFLFDNLAQKARTQKTLENRGFSKSFLETDVRHETAIFGPKDPKPEIPDVNLFSPFSSLFNNKNTNIC